MEWGAMRALCAQGHAIGEFAVAVRSAPDKEAQFAAMGGVPCMACRNELLNTITPQYAQALFSAERRCAYTEEIWRRQNLDARGHQTQPDRRRDDGSLERNTSKLACKWCLTWTSDYGWYTRGRSGVKMPACDKCRNKEDFWLMKEDPEAGVWNRY
jgi:hypothetical protein